MVRIVHDVLFFLPAGQIAAQAGAVAHVDAQRLDVAAADVRAVGGRRSDDAQRGRIRIHDEFRAGFVRQAGDLFALFLKEAQEAGVLDEDGGGVGGELAL